MDVIHLSAGSKAKPLSKVAQDLALSPTFAAPDQHSLTIALMAKHIDELRFRLAMIEAESRMSRWQRLRRWWVRT